MTAARNQQEWHYGYFAVIAAMLRLRLVVFYFRKKTILNWRDKFPFIRLRPCGSAQRGFCLVGAKTPSRH